LVNYFLKKFSQRSKQPPKKVVPDVLKALEQHNWPGNVRELENVIQRALVMAKGDTLTLNDLPAEFVQPGKTPPAAAAAPATSAAGASAGRSTAAPTDLAGVAQTLFKWARANPQLKVLPAMERELIIEALRETDGNQVQAAKLLGITRATLRKRVEKFHIRQELSIQ
ncbi:MAG: sigma-54-dependent Fis family transcriptional regulator, partial [Verrucomicrobia bacterium]|nr:sigma-54-dependent Fis family transcriptional regulator [Verrucomicrobiota bacterium]